MPVVALVSLIPFRHLPLKPVDLFEFRFFVVSHCEDDPRINAVRWLYHISSTWAEVCPDDAAFDGAAFVDDWMIFTDGRFTGRQDGWSSPLRSLPDRCFMTFAEARAEAMRGLGDASSYHQLKVGEIAYLLRQIMEMTEPAFE